MADPVLCIDNDSDEGQSAGAKAGRLQGVSQTLIEALIDIDVAYEREREKLSKSSPDVLSRARMQRKLREQHVQRRRSYVEQLIAVQDWGKPEVMEQSSNPSTRMLSALEADILRLLMDGMKDNAIALKLGLDQATIKAQIRSILRKVQPARLCPSLAGTDEGSASGFDAGLSDTLVGEDTDAGPILLPITRPCE